jgi:preprotein translocase subunit SecA
VSAIALPPLARLPEGLDGLVHGLQGRWRRRTGSASALRREALACLTACEALRGCAASDLQARLEQARERLRCDPQQARGELIQSLALVGQMAWRSLGQQPYAVQFMGALAIHRGWLAEMATGEGKTLTVALAAVLAGWAGRACHVLTANDYLATRDAQEMSPLYQACGVSVDTVAGEHDPVARQRQYLSDVVYLTAKELLGDHLRDLLALRSGRGPEQAALAHWLGQDTAAQGLTGALQCRGLHTAIVDEADSLLIDEAVTPLILSSPRPNPGLSDGILWAHDLAMSLVEGRDFEIQLRNRAVELGAGARAAMQARSQQLAPAWRPSARREELLRNALSVRFFYQRGHQYLVHDDEVVLLDEFTGRMTPGRTLTAGLHQAIEAHEGLVLTDPNESLGQMSFQSFFRRFRRLSGTTGTAREASQELWRIYRLAVLPVPTHRPRLTKVQAIQVLDSLDRKWQAVLRDVQQVHAQGRPVLVGVRSVESSEKLAGMLRQQGLKPSVLNAEQHALEAQIVAGAGEAGRITIATNMAGRGTDIGLSARVKSLGGLHVVIAECNESGRVDRQFAGRCGRQGDPGSVSQWLSLEDALLRRYFSSSALRCVWVLERHLRCLGQPVVRLCLRIAQRRAEADAFARRWAVLQNDSWMEGALPFEESGHG